MIIAWFSFGATSAVACKIALSLYKDVQLYHIETGSCHLDNDRFLSDYEKWYGQPIHTIRRGKYTCLKEKDGRIFLDELPTWRGDAVEEIIPDCSLICQIEFQEILDRQVEGVLKREISINGVT